MGSETYFKGLISKIDNNLDREHKREIIFRIINFNNIYFFAEEIVTGCIFPTYGFTSANDTNKYNMRFKSFSYIRSGKYFVFFPLMCNGNIFEYCLNESSLTSNGVKIMDLKEVKEYLESKENDVNWKNEIIKMEEQNKYSCDISYIKEEINKLKEGTKTVLDFKEYVPTYERYVPSISLEEVSNLGIDLSMQSNLCNIVGREVEKKQVIKTVCINKNSVLLVGNSDTGKTSIVESLASDIRDGNNEWLKDKIIFKIKNNIKMDTTIKEIEKLIELCKKNSDRIIVFIDDINNDYDDNRINILDILRSYVTSGDIRVIGTMTKDNYNDHVKNNLAYMKHFEVVEITLPSLEMNIEILLSYISSLEEKYNIKLDISDVHKSIFVEYLSMIDNNDYRGITIWKNIINSAFAEAIYNGKNIVTEEDIYFAISSCGSLPLSFRNSVLEGLKIKINSATEEELKTLKKVKTL